MAVDCHPRLLSDEACRGRNGGVLHLRPSGQNRAVLAGIVRDTSSAQGRSVPVSDVDEVVHVNRARKSSSRSQIRPLEKGQHRMRMASRWQERGSAEGSPGKAAMCADANFCHYMVRSEKAIALMITRHESLCCVASRPRLPDAGARPNASALPRQAFRPALASHSPQRRTPQVHQTPHWRLWPEARPRRLHPHPSPPAD